MKLLTQESIDAIIDPILLKDLHGVSITCNQAYLNFRKITSPELLGHTAYELLPKAQADLHYLADQYLLNSECTQFEYEELMESTLLKNMICRAKFLDSKSNVVSEIIKLETTWPAILEPKIHLTIREYSVLQLLIQGNSHKRMAQLLNLSQHTISSYIKTIYIKLGARSSTQAVLIATTKLGMCSNI